MAFKLTVYQLNCHHSRVVHTSLEASLPNSSYICLLQEPYLYEDNVCGLDSSRLYYLKDVATRVAIYTSADIKLTIHNDLSSRDCVTCSIKLSGQYYFFSSVYLDILTTVEEPAWVRCIDKCRQKGWHFLASVDTNAHSVLWGSKSNNVRGHDLEDLIFQHGLSLLNEGDAPTFESGVGISCIDITVASPQFATKVRNWKVEDEMHLSDHHLISFDIRLQAAKPELCKSRNLKKADWGQFQQLIEANLPPELPFFWTRKRIDAVADKLHEVILHSLDEVAPLRIHRPKKASLDWFTPELDDLRKKTRIAHLAARKDRGNKEKWDVFHALRHEYKSEMRKARQKSWKTFTTETVDMAKASRLNKILSKKKYREVGLLKLPDGNLTESTQESYQVLMDEHFPGCERAAPGVGSQVDMSQDDQPQLIDSISWIDESLVVRSISIFDDYKSAGPDGLKPIVLKHLPPVAIKVLVGLYTAMIRLHYTPLKWQQVHVIFLPKDGKESYLEKRSFRPISLYIYFLKACERLIQWNLEQIARPMHSKQYAYRKGLCAENALSGVVDKVEKALSTKKVALAVFLDIEGAFDNATSHAIEMGMREHGADEDCIQWFVNFLNNRTASVRGQRKHFKLNKGTGQGGVLSPVVWNYIMDTFLALFDRGRTEAFAFADDGALIILANNIKTATRLMQKALNKVCLWAQQKQLTFSAQKSVAVVFTNKKNNVLPKALKLYETPLKVVKEVKYLGVKLHHKLKWRPHVQEKVTSAKKHLMCIRNGFGSTWGPPPHINLWLYTGIVRPAITYGAVVWANSTKSAFIQRDLQRVQRLGLIMIAPMRPSTPTAGLELLTGVPPLDLQVQETAIQTSTRLNLQPSGWSGVNKRNKLEGHIKWLQSQMEGLPPKELQDRCVIPITHHKFTTFIGDGSDDTTIPGVRMYTDGSKSSHTGAAFIAFDEFSGDDPIWQRGAFLGEATVFQAEVFAIEGAAHYAANLEHEFVTIFSDSQSAIQAVSGHLAKSRTVFNAVKALNRLSQNKHVCIRWIQGHKGYLGNELADGLAKTASDWQVEGPGPFLPLPNCEIKSLARQLTTEKWKSKWLSSGHCRQTKLFFPEPNPKLSRELLRLSRKDLGLCIRHLTGHSFLKYHRSKVNPAVDPQCRLCQEAKEESAHIILDCPAFQEERLQCFWEYQPTSITALWQLLLFLSDQKISCLEQDSSSEEDSSFEDEP